MSRTGRPIVLLLLCILVQLFVARLSYGTKQPKRKIAPGQINRTIRITKMLCVRMPYKYTIVKHCEMEQFANGTVGLHISIHIPVVMNYIEISAKAYYKYTTYRPFMIDWSMEYCQAARNGRFNPTAAVIMKVVEESMPDFYYPCPHGNRTYTIFWLLPAKFIPETMPSGNYRLDIYYRDSGNTVFFALEMYGAVRKQGIVG